MLTIWLAGSKPEHFFISPYIGKKNPNWLSYLFRGVGQPPTSYYGVYYINHDSNEGGICFEHTKDLISIIHRAKLWVYSGHTLVACFSVVLSLCVCLLWSIHSSFDAGVCPVASTQKLHIATFPASIANWCLHVSHLLFETTFPMLHVHKTAVIPCRSPSLFHVFCSAILMISGSTKRITLWNNPWSTKRISGSEFHDLWIVYMISGLSHHFLDLTLKCFRNSSFDQLWSSSRVQKPSPARWSDLVGKAGDAGFGQHFAARKLWVARRSLSSLGDQPQAMTCGWIIVVIGRRCSMSIFFPDI